MKVTKRQLDHRTGAGIITLTPEDHEDLWHLYQLVSKGDYVKASTVRKVQIQSATGTSSSERIHTWLTIQVSDISFDSTQLRLRGRNKSENAYVKMDQYHTLDIEIGKSVSVSKPHWDAVHFARIDEACNNTSRADVAAIVCSEGVAHVCLITQYMTVEKQKIEVNVPKKRGGSAAGRDSALQKFHRQVFDSLKNHVKLDVVKCVILASPGFVKDQLFEYIFEEAVRQDLKQLQASRSKFILVHTSSGHMHALKEALADPTVAKTLEDTKASGEMRVLNEFFDILNSNPGRALYGPRHVLVASEMCAIQTLLITDSLFRSANVQQRQKWVDLVEFVKKSDGDVHIFSSMHVTGEQLNKLTGVAAILRFPVLLDEDEEPKADTSATPSSSAAQQQQQQQQDSDSSSSYYDSDEDSDSDALLASDSGSDSADRNMNSDDEADDSLLRGAQSGVAVTRRTFTSSSGTSSRDDTDADSDLMEQFSF